MPDGSLNGGRSLNQNPILDTRARDAEFPDGQILPVVVCVDSILVVYCDGMRSFSNENDHFFKTKDGSTQEPNFYL
jgi:hypothetical protein